MRDSSSFKTFLAAGIALLILSCNNSKKDKVKVNEVTLPDSQQGTTTAPYPPPTEPPPGVTMMPAPKKCFVNNGLKYKTVITIFYDEHNNIAGNVTSEELESGKRELKKFAGTMEDDKVKVTFENTAPTIGDASEWTNKAWTIKKAGKKETLQITFNAKNYNTDKWENSIYEFELIDCSK